MFDAKTLRRYKEEELKDALDWHENVNGVKDKKLLMAYESGFRMAWEKLTSLLKLHSLVKTKD